MHDALFQYIELKSGQKLGDDERKLIVSKFSPKHLRKGQYLLQEGDICQCMAFIVKGSARTFSTDKKGVEHTVRLALESWWLGDPESGIQQIPSRFNIEMLENSELLLLFGPDFYELRNKCHSFDLTIKAMDARAHIATQNRIHAAISMTAEERYDELAIAYPEFLQRFPRNMIASYLGISPETLSRIRKTVFRK